MKVNMKDLFDSYIDEGEINMTIRTEDVDMEKIRRDTMNWINEQEGKKTVKSTKNKRRIALVLIAAVVLIFGSISTTAYVRHLNVTTGLNADVPVSSTDGVTDWIAPKAEIVASASADGKAEQLGFRAAYVPEMDLAETDVTESPLSDGIALMDTDAAEHGEKFIAKVGEGDSGRALSDKEVYDGSLFYLHRSGLEGCCCIEIKSIVSVDRTFKIYNDSKVIKESTINGQQAVYMTTDLTEEGETDPNRSTLYRIIVFDETNNAFLNVSSSFGFEEVEKMIDGLEIVHTGIISSADSVDSDGGWLGGYGVG